MLGDLDPVYIRVLRIMSRLDYLAAQADPPGDPKSLRAWYG